MNVFETIKASVSVSEAARAYGLTVTRHNMTRCPFHDDRHPSLKINPDFYYCFGCGAKGDVIDLVAGVFNLSPYEAARKIAEDFGIDPDKPTEAAALAKPRHPMIRAFRDNERYCQRVLCDYLRLLENWKLQYAPVSMDEEPDDRFVEACQMFSYIEYLADLLTVGDLEQRKSVVMELMKDGKITGLEDRMNRAHEEERRFENVEEINVAS